MANEKFTPGRWNVVTNNPSIIWISSESHGGICTIPHNNKHVKEHEANANLISAAPDMYSALQLVLTHVKTWASYDPAVVKVLEEAVEKACPSSVKQIV